MSTNDYSTVFNVTEVGYKSWGFPAFGLLFVAVGLLLPFLRTGVFRKSSPTMEKWFPRIFLSFAIFWTSISFIGTFGDYRGAVAAMQNHRATMLEGFVSNFHPMPAAGHEMESFTVNGVKFEYSDYVRACPQDRLSVSAGIEKGGAKRSKTTVLPQIGVL
jgi:hypothetical protein